MDKNSLLPIADKISLHTGNVINWKKKELCQTPTDEVVECLQKLISIWKLGLKDKCLQTEREVDIGWRNQNDFQPILHEERSDIRLTVKLFLYTLDENAILEAINYTMKVLSVTDIDNLLVAIAPEISRGENVNGTHYPVSEYTLNNYNTEKLGNQNQQNQSIKRDLPGEERVAFTDAILRGLRDWVNRAGIQLEKLSKPKTEFESVKSEQKSQVNCHNDQNSNNSIKESIMDNSPGGKPNNQTINFGTAESLMKIWPMLQKLVEDDVVFHLGVSDLSFDQLKSLSDNVKIKPQINHVYLDCSSVLPTELSEYADEHGIQLVTHRDSSDMLPRSRLNDLLSSEFSGTDAEGWQPLWVARYSALYKSRAIVDAKGYTARLVREKPHTPSLSTVLAEMNM